MRGKLVFHKYKRKTPHNTMEILSSVQSQKQFEYVFHSYNPRLYYSLIQTLQKQFHMKNEQESKLFYIMKKRMTTMAKSGATDMEIYTYIHNFLNQYIYPLRPYGKPDHHNQGRSISRVGEIRDLIAETDMPFVSNKVTYLDFGCNTGAITTEICRQLFVGQECYGVDILPVNNVTNNLYKYIQIDEHLSTIPLPDNSVDIITSLMVLHHVDNPEHYIRELSRILKPGGIFILKEHNIDGQNDTDGQVFLDLLHGLYTVAWAVNGQQENPEHCINYSANYKKKEQWTEMLKEIGNIERLSTAITDRHYYAADIKRTYESGKFIRNVISSYWYIGEKK